MADYTQLTVRLEPDLHARLTQIAERERRSKHAQILVYIERGLRLDEGESGDGPR